MNTTPFLECDIAVIGGGLGGVAAALAACEGGAHVILTETTDWLGGQATSQLVSALDEHAHIEIFGGTRNYYRFRDGIRAIYQERFGKAIQNPGGGWVSNLCFEPRVGVEVIQHMLAPHVEAGALRVLLQHQPIQAHMDAECLKEVTLAGPTREQVTIRAAIFLDATELGDLLLMAGLPFASGAEAYEETYEPNASRNGPHPESVQAFTSCFILEHHPDEDHTLPKPPGYERWRDSQPFSLDVPGEAGGAPIHYPVFTPSRQGQLTFWTYRRIFAANDLCLGQGAHDQALINWDSNDYRGGNLIGASHQKQARLLANAKNLSRAFLYYLQTEVPRDDRAGRGYPGLCLSPEFAGTRDGFAKAPYIRELRRILGRTRVLEQDITAIHADSAARAKPFPDSVGVGFYPIDVHACCGGAMPEYHFASCLPYQIPLGALIPERASNLLAAAKNLSVTHITNGAYRLHPVEWNTGESAGALAAWCLAQGCSPAQVDSDPILLQRFQHQLLLRGVPLAWALDAPLSSPDFVPLQTCLTRAPFRPGSARFGRLELLPHEPISSGEAAALLGCLREAENPAVQDHLRSMSAAPDELVSEKALRDVFTLASLPVSPLTERPGYLQIARMLAPRLNSSPSEK